MDIHKNARLTVHGRERIIRLLDDGVTVEETAEMVGVSDRDARYGHLELLAVLFGAIKADD